MKTPKANRLHIGLFGRRNSGKSSLLNAITGQHAAIVSDTPGTTTDAVSKSMEVGGLGPVVFIDTAGFDDTGSLGEMRVEQTLREAERTDVALVLFPVDGESWEEERRWVEMFRGRDIPVVAVLSKADVGEVGKSTTGGRGAAVTALADLSPVAVSSMTGAGVDKLIETITAASHGDDAYASITGNLASEGDVVMLVMPQDAQAPKGRLILPQVQTIRELLDKKCTVVSCTPEGMEHSLAALNAAPKLIITDSQVFAAVNALTPASSRLTSFSVLFARHKGDIQAFIAGAAAIDALTPRSRVLIAEACTHAPATEDIGRVKLPRMLRARVGEGLTVDVVGGADFPDDLRGYDIVIHCGACMFNRRHVLSRIARATAAGVPITNYGIAIAHLTGILPKVACPE